MLMFRYLSELNTYLEILVTVAIYLQCGVGLFIKGIGYFVDIKYSLQCQQVVVW